jgi:L-ascorbate metabolism protein UlaG (beta-lactamase superfamily)
MRVRRLLRWVGLGLLSLFGLIVLGYGALAIVASDVTGEAPSGERLRRMQRSRAWHDGRFHNDLPRVDGSYLEMTARWFAGGSEHRTPSAPIPVAQRRRADYPDPPPPGLRVTWLGHSTLLLELDGYRLLIDPVFGQRASPFQFAGPERFFASPLPLSELPRVDAVLISHDHYDHLDTETVRALASRELLWIAPLGVGAHLEGWGVPAARIRELDWWQSARVRELQVTATPARHFSGRSVLFTDQHRTLWAGYALVAPEHRVFYSGDTALFDGFAEIGQRLGPFDLTLIEVGAYHAMWRDVHLGPEQAVVAHRMLRGGVLLPVHWGLFDLALHGWTEPIERVLIAARRQSVPLLTPRPGEVLELGDAPAVPAPSTSRWWPKVPFDTVEQHDARSSSVDALLRAYAGP